MLPKSSKTNQLTEAQVTVEFCFFSELHNCWYEKLSDGTIRKLKPQGNCKYN